MAVETRGSAASSGDFSPESDWDSRPKYQYFDQYPLAEEVGVAPGELHGSPLEEVLPLLGAAALAFAPVVGLGEVRYGSLQLPC